MLCYVAEYFKVEEVTETIRIFESIDGTEEKYRQEDFKNDETLEETLLAIGSVEVRQRKIKRKRVRKYIMSWRQGLRRCRIYRWQLHPCGACLRQAMVCG
jgi:hypothetical protein